MKNLTNHWRIGIPKDDLKLIWDRFYKSDLSRGKDKKGTGLGLSGGGGVADDAVDIKNALVQQDSFGIQVI